MKAAVFHEFGSLPGVEEFPEPTAEPGDVLVHVRAAVLDHFDRMAVAGVHYASQRMYPRFPAVAGHIGAGTLADGTLVTFGGCRPPYGTMAETAVVPKEYAAYMNPVPAGIDAGVAAALPPSALTSYLALTADVERRPGQNVLILGATGVAGQLAVRIASLLGARKVVAAGREASILDRLPGMGASAIVDLKREDTEVCEALVRESEAAYDVVLDYLWGHPMELLLRALTPSTAGFAGHRTRYVQIGQSAGAVVSFPAAALRTSGLELSGAGNISPAEVALALEQIWKWVREGKLSMDVEKIDLSRVSEAWQRRTPGRRIVLVP